MGASLPVASLARAWIVRENGDCRDQPRGHAPTRGQNSALHAYPRSGDRGYGSWCRGLRTAKLNGYRNRLCKRVWTLLLWGRLRCRKDLQRLSRDRSAVQFSPYFSLFLSILATGPFQGGWHHCRHCYYKQKRKCGFL